MPKQLDTVSRQQSQPSTPAPAATPPAKTEPTPQTAPQQDDYATLFPEPSVAINPPPNWIWWLLVLVISGIIGVVGYQFVRSNLDQWLSVQPPLVSTSPKTILPVASETPAATATPTPSATPSAAPSASASATTTPAIQKSSVSIHVLNGTTKAGAAAAAQKALTNNGFQVRSIGNARNQTYTQTYVYYQTGHKTEADLVAQALADYKPTVQEDTDSAAPDTVAVVVGP